MRILLLLILLAAGAWFYIYQIESEKDSVQKSRELINDARTSEFFTSCLKQVNDLPIPSKSRIDNRGFCKCAAGNISKIDRSGNNSMKDRLTQFFKISTPCFDKYHKPAFNEYCNSFNNLNEGKWHMSCACYYDYSIEILVDSWVNQQITGIINDDRQTLSKQSMAKCTKRIIK